MLKYTPITIALSLAGVALAHAAPVTLALSLKGSANQSLYRSTYSASGMPTDYRKPANAYVAFSGWQFDSQFTGLSGATQPDVTLHIQPATSNPAACNIKVVNRGLYAAKQQVQCTTESVFSVASNGVAVVMNPDIPNWVFLPTAQYPTPSCYSGSVPKPTTIQCSANIVGTAIVNGQTVTSNAVPVTLTLNPTPTPPGGSVDVTVKSTGLSTLPDNKGYILPIFIQNSSNPFAIPGIKSTTGLSAGAETNVYSVAPGSTYTFSAADSEADSHGCYYYPIYSFNGHSGESLTVNNPTNGMVVNAAWQRYCPTPTPAVSANAQHTISGGVQTKNRYEYGTFQVVMKPSPVSGTNSSFYTFFGDGMIPQAGTVYPDSSFYNWGYTWHEIDFEFVPGDHPVGLGPMDAPYGFTRPYASPTTIADGMSLNSFSPGNVVKGAFGSLQHHRFCPNANDPQCVGGSDPYDGQFHTFALTWTPTQIQYYMDGKLVNTLPIQDRSDGSASQSPNLLQQILFNNGGIVGSDGQLHLTSPQFISMNFWVPTQPGSFGAVFKALTASQMLQANYQSVKWSPCVDKGQYEATCNAPIGKVFSSDGTLLPAAEQQAQSWDFTQMTRANFLQDWMIAPAMSFDSNNSYFTQNGVQIDSTGLHLDMQNQWAHMATTGVPSKGPEGKMLLPPAGEVSPTDLNQALLVVHAVVTGASASQTINNVYPGIIPKAPANYPGTMPGYFNGGWLNNTTFPGTACQAGSVANNWCNSNGWFADPRFEKMTAGSDTGKIAATYIVQVQTADSSGKPLGAWTLTPSAAVMVGSQACSVRYTPATITLAPQQNATVSAEVVCPEG